VGPTDVGPRGGSPVFRPAWGSVLGFPRGGSQVVGGGAGPVGSPFVFHLGGSPVGCPLWGVPPCESPVWDPSWGFPVVGPPCGVPLEGVPL
jgi:hypothetical protein